MAYGPKLVYGSGPTTMNFVSADGAYGWPTNFRCYAAPIIAGDNLSDSGAVRERVMRGLSWLIEFELNALPVSGYGSRMTLRQWHEFMEAYGLFGVPFQFYAHQSVGSYVNCVLEDVQFGAAKRVAPGLYSVGKVTFRILNDANAPATAATLVDWFNGLTV